MHTLSMKVNVMKSTPIMLGTWVSVNTGNGQAFTKFNKDMS